MNRKQFFQSLLGIAGAAVLPKIPEAQKTISIDLSSKPLIPFNPALSNPEFVGTYKQLRETLKNYNNKSKLTNLIKNISKN